MVRLIRRILGLISGYRLLQKFRLASAINTSFVHEPFNYILKGITTHVTFGNKRADFYRGHFFGDTLYIRVLPNGFLLKSLIVYK